MPSALRGSGRPRQIQKVDRGQKRKRDDVDAGKLEEAVSALDPNATYSSFSDLPLSAPTTAGLKSAHFSALTDIQSKAIPFALKRRDILGAAKTGSGKTLAFLIPILENLYRAQWMGADAGLGALIISPTRELAIQIFDVLRNIGRKGHLFAAGLVIGGKSLREEQDALVRMNIVVGTPGRILQHLSQTAAFNVDHLQMLVLDEADRILDMGFRRDVDAIVEYLPRERQTLLFSATQTKRVSDLARLSLRDPEYVSVHEAAASATPKTLQQSYVVTPLPEKLDTLWSFLQSSKKSKILVFLSSGKQVRFVYESFRHMQPGIPLLHLHGRQKQTARLDITEKFSRAKHSCLFATDVVARGLDFPAVDWVVQVDFPEDADTYIHRVGRTARYEREGRAVLFLDPSEEEGALKRLEQKKIPIERINVRAKKQQSIKNQLQNLCFQDPSLKYLGQKAFASYVRSLHIQQDKETFQLDKYALGDFASSLGLPGAPRIKFLKADADEIKRKKNAPRQALSDDDEEDETEDRNEEVSGQPNNLDKDDVMKNRAGKNGVRTKYDRMFERQNQDVLADHFQKMIRDDDDDAGKFDGEQVEDDDLFDVKRRIPAEGESDEERRTVISEAKVVHLAGAKDPLVLDSKRREKLLKSKKKLLKLKDKGSKLVFDDEGNAHEIYELEDEDAFKAKGDAEAQRQQFLRSEVEKARVADLDDKEYAREKKRAKREKRRERERMEDEDEDDENMEDGPVLEGNEDAFANFLADAEAAADDNSDDDDDDDDDEGSIDNAASSDEETHATKKQKKWFQNDKASLRQQKEPGREIETFDDLEAEAAKLLA